LIEVASSCLKQAQKMKTILENLNSSNTDNLIQKFVIFLTRIQQVIEQTQRRILSQEKVPSSEKIVSIFEAHTDIICRGKINVDVEFGHKVWLDEVDGGIISNYRILKGNPHDTQQLIPSLDQHVKNFGHPPKTLTTDRGVYSNTNEQYASDIGVKEVVLPKGGYRSKERIQHERKRKFKKARHWHNGVEGRISFLKRCFGFQRCLYRGELGFYRWIGWGVLAHNLTIISRNTKSISSN
jgi:transposase, IS5 family